MEVSEPRKRERNENATSEQREYREKTISHSRESRERSKKKTEYFPTIKKEFERLQSDTIMTGGMLGKYNATMSIFGLKNWCNWKDKAEIEQDNTGVLETLVKIRECAIENNRNNRD